MARQFDPEDFVDPSRQADVAARMRRREEKVEEATSGHMAWLEESGELRHLHGKPLDLSDDPNWLATKVLKNAGFSHPLLEQRKELHAPLTAFESRLTALSRQRDWLTQPSSRSTPEDYRLFNQDRDRVFDQYRAKVLEVNARIRDFNLTAPDALHERPIRIDRALREIEERIPPLDEAEVHRSSPSSEGRRWWHALRNRRRGD